MEVENGIVRYNSNGFKAKFLSLGARWAEMYVPDRWNKFEDILLGFKTNTEYLNAEEKYYGAVVGRYCGRILNGKLSGFDNALQLSLNDLRKHHLHGGISGFHMQK